MWHLDAATFVLCSVHDPSRYRYAALSHVWDARGEASFQVLYIYSYSPSTCLTSAIQDIHALHADIGRTLGSDPDGEQVIWSAMTSVSSGRRLSEPVHCTDPWLPVHLVRHVLHKQDEQRRTLGGDQLHVRVVRPSQRMLCVLPP